jgi:hypothetical protein
VVTPPPLRSTETVKAVSMGSVLLLTITCNPNSLQRLSVNGHKSIHVRELPWSWSFLSYFSAAAKITFVFSIFIINNYDYFPWRMSSIASIVLSCILFWSW